MKERTCVRCKDVFTADNGGRGQWQRFCSDECKQAKPPEPPRPPCAVPGCDKLTRRPGAGMCEMHYYRVRRTGATDVANPQRTSRGQCIYTGCDRLDGGPSGYCDLHQGRIRRQGDPSIRLNPGQPAGPSHASYRGDDITYHGAHSRVRAYRGPASTHRCVDCGDDAAHWSYDHSASNEMDSPEGRYSPDVEHYRPRCVRCHKVYDLARAA